MVISSQLVSSEVTLLLILLIRGGTMIVGGAVLAIHGKAISDNTPSTRETSRPAFAREGQMQAACVKTVTIHSRFVERWVQALSETEADLLPMNILECLETSEKE